MTAMWTAISNSSGNASLRYENPMMRRPATTLKDYTATFFGEGKVLTRERREELILKYTPLINYVAGRLAMRLPPHISVNDLISSGIVGLIDAVEKFDPAKNIQFKTYAEFRIRGAMLDELRSMDWIPRSVRKKASDLERTYWRLEKKLGRPVEDEEVAEEIGITLDEFYKLLDDTRHATFLDIEMIRRRMSDNNEDDLFDLIADDDDIDPFTRLNMTEVKELFIAAIRELPDKEKLVVSLYYYEHLTMREIGEIMGYTESRISQMHTKAMLRLRAKLASTAKELNGSFL